MIRASMSKLELLSSCGYWAREGVAWTRLTSSDATFGTGLHALAAGHISGAPVGNLTELYPDLSDTEHEHLLTVWATVRDYINKNKRLGWRPEVVLTYDPATDVARQLKSEGHAARSYEAMGADLTRELPGSADLAYLGEDELGAFGCIDDWKWSGFHGDDMRAMRAQAQLEGLGLAWARFCGVDRVRLRALRISDEGVDDTSEVYWLDIFELERVRSDVATRLAAIETAEPTPGPWCADRWCPAIAACPRTATALEQIMPASSLLSRRPEMRLSTEIASAEHAAWMLTALDLIKGGTKEIKAAIEAYADANDGIQLADGRVWGGKEVAIEKADPDAPGALDELRALGLDGAVERSVTLTWEACKRAGGPDAEKKARAALQAIGATKVSSYRKYEARAPKRKKSAA